MHNAYITNLMMTSILIICEVEFSFSYHVWILKFRGVVHPNPQAARGIQSGMFLEGLLTF